MIPILSSLFTLLGFAFTETDQPQQILILEEIVIEENKSNDVKKLLDNYKGFAKKQPGYIGTKILTSSYVNGKYTITNIQEWATQLDFEKAYNKALKDNNLSKMAKLAIKRHFYNIPDDLGKRIHFEESAEKPSIK